MLRRDFAWLVFVVALLLASYSMLSAATRAHDAEAALWDSQQGAMRDVIVNLSKASARVDTEYVPIRAKRDTAWIEVAKYIDLDLPVPATLVREVKVRDSATVAHCEIGRSICEQRVEAWRQLAQSEGAEADFWERRARPSLVVQVRQCSPYLAGGLLLGMVLK